MMSTHQKNKINIKKVSTAMHNITEKVMFIGGAVLGFYLEDAIAKGIRNTLDVDLVVEVVTRDGRYRLEKDLRKRGFLESHELACRWVYEGIVVDVITAEDTGLGANSPWFRGALDRAQTVFCENTPILIPSILDFLALKFDAMRDRDEGDFLGKDCEDIISIIDGALFLLPEKQDKDPYPQVLKKHLHIQLESLTTEGSFQNIYPGQLPIRSQPRAIRFLNRVEELKKYLLQ